MIEFLNKINNILVQWFSSWPISVFRLAPVRYNDATSSAYQLRTVSEAVCVQDYFNAFLTCSSVPSLPSIMKAENLKDGFGFLINHWFFDNGVGCNVTFERCDQRQIFEPVWLFRIQFNCCFSLIYMEGSGFD